MGAAGTERLLVGTRRSPLAMAQTQWVTDQLRQQHPGIDLVIERITTRGDRDRRRPLPDIGAKGLFTRDLEEALLAGRIDLAIHSAKDLPTDMPAGLAILAAPAREDPRDALITRQAARLADLPAGAVVGTSSLRRQAQLRMLRGDLQFVGLRGNVDTRIRKVQRGDCDATVLAVAGLNRASLSEHINETFDPTAMLPAPGQGALAIQGRADDEAARRLVAAIDDQQTAAAVQCERRIVELLGAGCRTPVGALAQVEAGLVRCKAIVATPDGSRVARAACTRPVEQWAELAETITAELVEGGAGAIIQQCRGKLEA